MRGEGRPGKPAGAQATCGTLTPWRSALPSSSPSSTSRRACGQQFIGHLGALGSLAAVAGAFIYAPLSRRGPLKRLINVSIGAGVAGLLAYLLYRDAWSAVVIDVVFGCVGMIANLAFLDLAAKACPRRVEATFFALLMAVSAAFTAVGWLLVPLVKIDRIEAKAQAAAVEGYRVSRWPASGPHARPPAAGLAPGPTGRAPAAGRPRPPGTCRGRRGTRSRPRPAPSSRERFQEHAEPRGVRSP